MSQISGAPTILIVEDDRGIREALSSCLESPRHKTVPAASVADARAQMRANPALRLMVADLGLPDGSGLDLITEFIQEGENRAVIVVTASTDEGNIVRAMQLGAMECAIKPFDVGTIRRQAAHALEQNRQLRLISRGRERMVSKKREFLIGRSPAIIQIKKEIGLAARSEAPVLISGEPGTERMAVARAIHAYGSRAKEPLLVLECRRLSPEALEERLLAPISSGGLRSAGGGGYRLRPTGTVLLNDVEFITAGTQCKMLDAVEKPNAAPDAAGRRPPRIISATSVSPSTILSRGSLCEDMVFQLAAIEVDIPPLRTRSSDIPLIVEALLRDPGQTERVPVRVSPSAMDVLKRYEWPGNVKELERFLARAVTLGSRGVVGTEDIPRYMKSPARAINLDSTIHGDSQPPPLRELERRYAQSVLEYTNGVKTAAARLLKISRGTLEVLLKGPRGKAKRKK